MVTIGNGGHQRMQVRALLDPCSEVTLLRVDIARRLGGELERVNVGVAGVSGSPMDCARIRTWLYFYGTQLSGLKTAVYGLRRIGIITPASPLPVDATRLATSLDLADPEFNIPRGVDAVIGADLYPKVLLSETLRDDNLLAQSTVFGWTITGVIDSRRHPPAITSACTPLQTQRDEPCHERLVDLVQRFWALEEVPRAYKRSEDDVECERLFVNGHSRNEDGRYVVPLPLRAGGVSLLGESLSQARSALSAMHGRMRRDPKLASAYKIFMENYAKLGHMRRLDHNEITRTDVPTCYICHHGIWQRSDTEDKIRVVFNASRPTRSGHSLNDALYSGPKLQNNLAIVVTRWRMYCVVFCADVSMMFRQIMIRPEHTHLQRILWSPTPEIPASHYALQTVTYGETCAPYLALRTLKQLCIDEGSDLPEAVDVINNDLYVDDFLSGADDLKGACQRRDQLIKLLQSGGMTLRKWVSNSSELLDGIAPDNRLRPSWLQFLTDGPVNELGIAWDPANDCFRFAKPREHENTRTTKRTILAGLARIFDPAGWLAPVVVVAKILIQDLWRAKIGWDEVVPQPWSHRWLEFQTTIRTADRLVLPRWTRARHPLTIELHAFADASRRAMAAAVYCRVSGSLGLPASATLLWAKTKLSPIRSLIPSEKSATRMTIPRLELRAALMAAKLIRCIASNLNIPFTDCFIWSDSLVALHWIGMNDPTGNNIVDDYVAHIQELVPGARWRYVPTAQNPADIATRGTDIDGLVRSNLWWEGPDWLKSEAETWPTRTPGAYQSEISSTAVINLNTAQTILDEPEPQTMISCNVAQAVSNDEHPADKFSSLSRLLKASARCRRLLLGKKHPTTPVVMSPVGAAEISREYEAHARLSQKLYFGLEMRQLRQGGPIGNDSPLRTLAPFLDEDTGVLRVGGRLEHSLLPATQRHPIILSSRSHLSRLTIEWAHLRSLHGGFRTTYTHVIQRAWIVNGRTRIRSYIRQCAVCARSNARPRTQEMAQLPAIRVTPSAAFLRTGVDYTGPFNILGTKGRGIRSYKGYVAVFICMATKAVHLELVGDLTTASFLGALDRFIGRRGQPQELWSDNATTFRGADAELRRLRRAAVLDLGLVESHLADRGISWRFIPPSAPHFGGLWEAAVKSAKSHLRRVAGPRKMTFEEFSTLLVNIERVLNCRPLVPLSGDPDDLEVLTPGHFLIGRSLASTPHLTDMNTPLDHARHWTLVKGLRDRFWTRWSREYLNTLQQRNRWTRRNPNLAVNDLVVVIDPPLLRTDGRWPLGRIISVHPGSDGLVRVATVRTESGTYTRPVTKIVLLPIRHEDPAVQRTP